MDYCVADDTNKIILEIRLKKKSLNDSSPLILLSVEYSRGKLKNDTK